MFYFLILRLCRIGAAVQRTHIGLIVEEYRTYLPSFWWTVDSKILSPSSKIYPPN